MPIRGIEAGAFTCGRKGGRRGEAGKAKGHTKNSPKTGNGVLPPGMPGCPKVLSLEKRRKRSFVNGAVFLGRTVAKTVCLCYNIPIVAKRKGNGYEKRVGSGGRRHAGAVQRRGDGCSDGAGRSF